MIQVDLSREDLLILVGALVKVQVSNGAKDEKLTDLASRLSLQAIDKLSLKDINDMINK